MNCPKTASDSFVAFVPYPCVKEYCPAAVVFKPKAADVTPDAVTLCPKAMELLPCAFAPFPPAKVTLFQL